MPFIIDTDALIHIRNRPNAQEVYSRLIPLCQSSEIVTVSQVFDEMKRWPDIWELFRPHRKSMKVNQYHPDVLTLVGYISDSFESLYDLTGVKNPDPADPWLIACAKIFDYTLVTDERVNSTKKIPYVCRQQSILVPCINGNAMLQEIGIL